MALETMDFQSLVHQRVSELIEEWKAAAFSEEDVQDSANQIFNMGLIAGQQIQQEGGIQQQGSEQIIPYTEETAQKVVLWFLTGMNLALLKAHEQKLPAQDKWPILQNVAYHLFEQSKQVVLATLGQESTPGAQISDDQVKNWLSQTAGEALLYYVSEHEKQYGPIRSTDQQQMSDILLQEPEAIAEELPPPVETPPPVEVEKIPEIYHKYAAVSLFLSNLPPNKQQKIMASFSPQEHEIINRYRDPDQMTRELDLGKVAQYLRKFKEKMGHGTPKKPVKNAHHASMAKVISKLPKERLERLFQNERPFVKGYIKQFTRPEERALQPYTLPRGVEESLVDYIGRNFPQEMGAL